MRFIAGVGLAGGVGAGITLIAGAMPRGKRGYGTMIIVTVGALGAVFASLVGGHGQGISAAIENVTGHALMNWQVAYVVGGASPSWVLSFGGGLCVCMWVSVCVL